MQKGLNRYEVPMNYEFAILSAQNQIRFYKSYKELSKEMGLSVNTIWKAITGEKISIKSWEKIEKWDKKKKSPPSPP